MRKLTKISIMKKASITISRSAKRLKVVSESGYARMMGSVIAM